MASLDLKSKQLEDHRRGRKERIDRAMAHAAHEARQRGEDVIDLTEFRRKEE